MLWKAFCHNVVRKQQLYKGSGKDVVNLLVSRSYLVVVLNPQILSLPSLSGCYFRACVLISIPQTCYGQRHEGCFITKQITIFHSKKHVILRSSLNSLNRPHGKAANGFRKLYRSAFDMNAGSCPKHSFCLVRSCAASCQRFVLLKPLLQLTSFGQQRQCLLRTLPSIHQRLHPEARCKTELHPQQPQQSPSSAQTLGTLCLASPNVQKANRN